MTRIGFSQIILILAVTLSNCTSTNAQTIVDFVDGETPSVFSDITYGYDFTVSDTLLVFGLGVFESFDRPLESEHEVGLWDAAGNLLAEVSVDGNALVVESENTLGHFRTANISPRLLSSGQYFVGAHYFADNDDILTFGTDVAIEGVEYGSARFSFGTELQFPDSAFGTSLVGGSVFGSVSVPEPSCTIIFLFVTTFTLRRNKQW